MADRVIFVCTLLLAGGYFYATENLPTLEIGDPLGPKAFPRLLGAALLLTLVVLAYEMVRARRSASAAKESAEPVDPRTYLVVGLVSVWTFLYYLAFEPLGYVIASSLYLVVLTAYFNRGRWVANVLTSILFSLGSYLLFTKALGVNLARGILPF